jgi:hypothetical protein
VRAASLALTALLGAFPAVAPAVPPETVPVPAEVAPFVPAGQRAFAVSRADLNRDGRPDVLLVLEPVAPTEDGMTEADARELVVLVRGADGRLAVAARNRKAVLCARCGGMMGDPVQAVEAKPGAIVVEHHGGSGWRWATTTRFAWSRIYRAWQLVEFRTTSYHASEPERMKTTAERPPRDFGKIDLADWDPEAPRRGSRPTR